ncbi:hypothetical protein KXW43_006318, partial [Aspergillus fumigatus]
PVIPSGASPETTSVPPAARTPVTPLATGAAARAAVGAGAGLAGFELQNALRSGDSWRAVVEKQSSPTASAALIRSPARMLSRTYTIGQHELHPCLVSAIAAVEKSSMGVLHMVVHKVISHSSLILQGSLSEPNEGRGMPKNP